MPMSLADARFFADRAFGLIRRGVASLRTRGWGSSWQRVKAQFQHVPAALRPALYAPAEAPFAPFAVPHSDTPRASIVIPVYNQFAHTLTCLRALGEHPPQAAVEIIVVDDGSSDATTSALPQVAGLRYHRRASNGGFIAACNDGAALARGDCLVFLNNDTVPQPGWLDVLLRTFDEHPGTGLVGAQLLYPDGRLQEAGGVVFADGSGWNYGRFGAPGDCRYAYVRDCDYASGAAIAIPRALFAELGGFDTRYAPAYYEDTDLAFAVRAARPAGAVPARRAGGACRRRDRRHRHRQRNQGLPAAQSRTLRRQVARRAGTTTDRGHGAVAGDAARRQAAGAGHRRADAAQRPRFRLAAAGQPDAPAARGRGARGVPAGQSRPCRRLYRTAAATRRRSLACAARGPGPGLAARARPAFRHGRWCAAITSRANSCRCCGGTRRRRGSCSIRSTCITCASNAAPNWPATRHCGARLRRPARWNLR